MRESGSGLHLIWAAAAQPYPGERVCGDSHCVRQEPAWARVAVVDGLGHGEEAAEAARTAVERLSNAPYDGSPERLLEEAHRSLRHTRGAAVSVAEIAAASGRMRWLGVGNVEGIVIRSTSAPGARRDAARERLLLRGGVVGQNLPILRSSEVALRSGDVLVMATDGIRAAFADRLRPDGPPAVVADRILAEHGRPTDDALVLVARWMGGAA